jgi:YbgC/YbaW family acyl-CoA thioester hydrolase
MKKIETRIKVRSYEVDFFRHVNNAVYVQYLELARRDMYEKIGFSLEKAYDSGQYPVIVNININYELQSVMGDDLMISSHISKIGRSSFTIRQQGYNLSQGNKPAFDADVVAAFIDVKTNLSVPIPQAVLNKLQSLLT